MATTTSRGRSVELYNKYLRVSTSSSLCHSSDYHYFWLRHNCNCTLGCRHPLTKERVIDSSEVALNIRPDHVQVTEEQLVVHWQKGENDNEEHLSEYSWEWLEEHAYAKNYNFVSPIPNQVENVQIDYKDFLVKFGGDGTDGLTDEGQLEYRRECGRILKSYGLIIVRNRGLDTEQIINDFLPSDKSVIETHFGRIEDLRTDNTTNKNNDQLGYTNAGVNLHTDQPFIESPPGMQLLHCITPADQGGENFIVDARHAALWLRDHDPISFDILTRLPVTFHRKQQKFESIQKRCIIELLDNGEIGQMRYSYFTYAPHNVPFHMMEEYYKAHNSFTRLVRDRNNQYRFLLNSGDAVLYDNHRCFHAREPFSGPRHVRGVYFNSRDVHEHLFIQ